MARDDLRPTQREGCFSGGTSMPSQYEHHLLPPRITPDSALKGRLSRRNPEAERQLLAVYNLAHPTEPPVRLPAPGAGYSQYTPLHLGLLWQHVRNLEALAVFAGPLWTSGLPLTHALTTPEDVATFYRTLSLPLLRRLWSLSCDADAFRELLRRGERATIRELVERCKSRSYPAGTTVLAEEGSYFEYSSPLLALLWSIGGNREAFDVLSQRELGRSLPEAITTWPNPFLDQLWKQARDGGALGELWRREGLDVHQKLHAGTPSRVLGYRWCFHRDESACEELIRRYRAIPLPAGAHHPTERHKDHYEDRVLRLLQQMLEWDYREYPELAGWLRIVERNAQIDRARRGQHVPRAAFGTTATTYSDPEDERSAAALRAVDQQDELDAQHDWERIAVLKLKEGIRLSDRELDCVVRDNLLHRGVTHPTAEQLAEERAVVCQAIEALRASRKKPVVKTVLKSHKPIRHSQLKRISKLCVLRDVFAATLAELPASTHESVVQILSDLDVLRDRSNNAKWTESLAPAAFVARLQRRVRDTLADAARAGTHPTLLHACYSALHDFLREFPLLVKAACVRDWANAVRSVRPDLGVIEEQILDWLDAGRRWLSTLHKHDGAACQRFLTQLNAETAETAAAEPTLQLLWLASIVRPGRPTSRLTDLEEVLQTLIELGLIAQPEIRVAVDALLRAARAGNELRVTASANRLRTAVADLPESWDVGRLRKALHRLGGRQAREHALLALGCTLAAQTSHALPRGLREWLDRDGCLGESDGPDVEEGRGLRQKLRQSIDPNETPSSRGIVFRMLDLLLGTLLNEGLPGSTTESLGAVWSICHADRMWPSEIRELSEELVAAAWLASQVWSEPESWAAVAATAARMRKRVPHCHAIPAAIRDELVRTLARLARGPRLRTTGGK